MRYTGTQARGIRLPIINRGDALAEIVATHVVEAGKSEGFSIKSTDVIGITEAVVAKSQSNYATLDQLAEDIKSKFPKGEIGVVFPILSRNRFVNILKGIVKAAGESGKVYVLLSYPYDEVGNPIMDSQKMDDVNDQLKKLSPIPASKFREIAGEFKHPFTDMDYISLYESIGADIYFSTDPRDILKLTPHVIAADIHTRFLTKKRLQQAGAETVFTLSEILDKPVNGSGFNPDYGVLGSNISTETTLKLFPKDCGAFLEEVQNQVEKLVGTRPEVMVYGDGAFKDPVCGIWELADPVVSPAFTPRLGGQPNEIKMKMVADTQLSGIQGEEQTQAIKEIIRQKESANMGNFAKEGTTPRKYADLLGSLCDLVSGSGDKGTPVVLIQGYFDSYADA